MAGTARHTWAARGTRPSEETGLSLAKFAIDLTPRPIPAAMKIAYLHQARHRECARPGQMSALRDICLTVGLPLLTMVVTAGVPGR